MRIIRAPDAPPPTVGTIPPKTIFEVKGALGQLYSKTVARKFFMPELKKEIVVNAFEHFSGEVCTLADDMLVVIHPAADLVLAGVQVAVAEVKNEVPANPA